MAWYGNGGNVTWRDQRRCSWWGYLTVKTAFSMTLVKSGRFEMGLWFSTETCSNCSFSTVVRYSCLKPWAKLETKGMRLLMLSSCHSRKKKKIPIDNCPLPLKAVDFCIYNEIYYSWAFFSRQKVALDFIWVFQFKESKLFS